MKSILPKDLADQGFLFDQITVPTDIIRYVRELPFEYCIHEDHTDVKYGAYDIGVNEGLTLLLPWDLSNYKVFWQAKVHDEGFYLHPHRAYHGDNTEYQGPAMALMWITPDIYHGREYVYGEFTDVDFSQKIFPWEYPYLVEKGRIQPKTGTVCVMDRLHYKWWHGVTRQESGRVITLIGELRSI